MNAIDLFAGAGGFTEGACMAGVDVLWAANHWPAAVQTHAANHPHVEHACQDLQQAAWPMVPKHDVLMASPACQGHSHARGRERGHHDAQRSTAWAVVACAEFHRSPVVLVENVPAFATWALYPSWRDAMSRLGYAVAPHLIDAADHGVPQHRVRLILVCTRTKHPLELTMPRQDHVAIDRVIEWDAYPWSPIATKGRSAKTLARLQVGRATFGQRFVAPYYGSGSGLQGRSISRPIGTITTVDRWAVVDGERMRMLQVPEAKAAMGFRASYTLPSNKRNAMQMLGNAVCPPMISNVLTAIRNQA